MVYLPEQLILIKLNFEVDSTESIWYTLSVPAAHFLAILKLTPQSQYGITPPDPPASNPAF